MPAPSQLKIATQAVERLIKEKTYYEKELAQQEARLLQLQDAPKSVDDDGNADFMLKQEERARDETKAVFTPLCGKIHEAALRLEEHLSTAQSESQGQEDEEQAKAKVVLEQGRSAGQIAA